MQSLIKWNYLSLAYLALFCLGLIDNTRGAFYPEFLKDLQLSSSEGSRLFSIVAFSGFAMNFTTRFWLPKVGIVKAVIASLFFMNIGTILISIIPYFKDHALVLLSIFSLILGLGIGGSTISMNLLVAKGTPEKYLTQAFAGLHSTYGVSSLIAPLLFNICFGLLNKWNLAFAILSPLPLVIGIYFLVKRPNEIIEVSQGPLKAPISFWKRIPFGVMLATYVMAEVLVSTRLVYFLTEVHKYELSKANNYLALFFSGLACGRLLFSFIKFPGSPFQKLFLSQFLSLIFYFLGQWHPGFYACLGLSFSWYFPTTMVWLQSKFNQGIEFMTVSVLTCSGFLLLLMHDLFGRIAEISNITSAFMLAPLASIVSFILLIYLERTKARQISG